MGTLKAAIIGFVAALALVSGVAAAFVPDPPMTITVAPDTYLRVLCEDPAAAMVLIPGAPGEGWAVCPRVSK